MCTDYLNLVILSVCVCHLFSRVVVFVHCIKTQFMTCWVKKADNILLFFVDALVLCFSVFFSNLT